MLISIIRTCFLYFLILFAVRMMGKRQIGEMQTSELVITLLMSNIATIPMQDTEQSMLSGIIPIMALLICEIFLSYLMLKRTRIRKVICGKPVIVIHQGTIDQKAMSQLRLSTEDLFEQLRQKDIFDISEVAFAIVETNGLLSVMKKSGREPLCAEDLGIRKPENDLMVEIISDGSVAPASLKICGWNEKKLRSILEKEKTKLQDVFIMTADSSGKYRIVRKEKNRHV